jgi:hypothetical protein
MVHCRMDADLHWRPRTSSQPAVSSSHPDTPSVSRAMVQQCDDRRRFIEAALQNVVGDQAGLIESK